MASLQHSFGSAISSFWGFVIPTRASRTQVLMYHSIGGSADGDHRGLYSVSPKVFHAQIETLGDQAPDGTSIVVPFGDELPGQISITFDDGYVDNLTVVAPTMVGRSFPFHIFLCPAFVESGRPGFLTRRDVLELAAIPGASLGVHGYSHRQLTTLDSRSLKEELISSRQWLEDLIQRPVTSMSYPHGAFDIRVMDTVQETGFTHAACSKFGPIEGGSSPLRIPRIDIWSTDTNATFTSKIKGHWDWMKWRT